MSCDKAPDNMPTELIRTFIKTAESNAHEWTITAGRNRRALDAAEEMVEKLTQDIEKYNEWLHNRLEQEKR